MPQIDIHRAKISEASQILDTQKLAYVSEAEIYNDYDIPPLTQTLEQLKKDFDNSIFYVAKIDGNIVGSITLKIDGYTGHIGRLIVAPNHQNQGIGSMLMTYVERCHSDLKEFELFTGHKSELNLAMYGARGFIEFRRQSVQAGLTFVYMRKQIANNQLHATSKAGA